MILLDANILLYAFSSSSPHHVPAREWLREAMDHRVELALPWITILAFLRLATSERAYSQAYSMQEAQLLLEDLLANSNVQLLAPTPTHWRIFIRLLVDAQVSSRLINDAHLAALALEHEAALCTNDRDFTRFPGLKIVNPIAKH